MKLIYWLVPYQADSTAYSIRKKTKKAAKEAHVASCHCNSETCGTKKASYDDCHGTLQKVEMEYDNGFQLMEQCLGEDRGMCLVVNDAEDA